MMNRREFLCSASMVVAGMSLPVVLRAKQPGPQHRLPTRRVPSTGEELPIVGFGNSQAFRNGDIDVTHALLQVLMDFGGRFIDTGGQSQFTLGEVMQEKQIRNQLFLGTNIDPVDEQAGLQYVEQSQDVQGKKPLDLLQLRRPSDLNKEWRAMRKWKEAGMTRFLGVAISRKQYYEPLIALMKTGTIDFVQVNYSMLEPESAERLLPLAQDQGIAVITNRPFINGQYFSLVKGKALPAWAADFDCESWAQFSLKYILAHPAVTCAITETANPKHAVDNLSAGLGRLPDERTRQRMLRVMQSM